MTHPTPPSATPMSDEQEDELDSIIAYINGCTRKPDGTLFLAQADYLKNLITHHTKEAVADALDALWEDVCKIETFMVSIPVNYTPDSQVLRIPIEDERGRSYMVIGVPKGYLQQMFQKHMLAAPQQSTSPDGSAE